MNLHYTFRSVQTRLIPISNKQVFYTWRFFIFSTSKQQLAEIYKLSQTKPDGPKDRNFLIINSYRILKLLRDQYKGQMQIFKAEDETTNKIGIHDYFHQYIVLQDSKEVLVEKLSIDEKVTSTYTNRLSAISVIFLTSCFLFMEFKTQVHLHAERYPILGVLLLTYTDLASEYISEQISTETRTTSAIRQTSFRPKSLVNSLLGPFQI